MSKDNIVGEIILDICKRDGYSDAEANDVLAVFYSEPAILEALTIYGEQCFKEGQKRGMEKSQEVLDEMMEQVRSDYKSLEASWMALKDDYSEICRALGFEGDAWFGDPLAKHEDIVARAKELQALSEDKV